MIAEMTMGRTIPVGTVSYIDRYDLPLETHFARARDIVAMGAEYAIVGDVEASSSVFSACPEWLDHSRTCRIQSSTGSTCPRKPGGMNEESAALRLPARLFRGVNHFGITYQMRPKPFWLPNQLTHDAPKTNRWRSQRQARG
jgi:hypothetical protein